MSNENPLITVVIPTFRRPHLLKKTIKSVLNQTFPHFQVCVYDDASCDQTAAVVAEYTALDKRVIYREHPKNIGSNNNWQYGLMQVNTPFFVCLSDDDLFMPTFLEEAMKAFAHHPEAGMFIGGIVFLDEKRCVKAIQLNEWIEQNHYSPKELIAALMQGRPFPYWASMVFRKEVKERLGQLKSELLWHDTEFLMRAFKQFSAVISSIPCSIFYVHSSNISLSLTMEEFFNIKTHFHSMIEGLFSPDEKMILRETYKKYARKELLEFSCQKFAARCFNESLQGIAILEKDYSLNPIEKLLRFISKQCKKNKYVFDLLLPLIFLRRFFVRYYNMCRLKYKLSKASFESFKSIIRL